MELRQPNPIPFYVTACDRHGRSPSREPVVAGTDFACETGYPALPFGCGHPSYIPFAGAATRWLVLAPASARDVERYEGGARVFRASIVFDGDKEALIAFLRESGGRGMPHLFRRLETSASTTFAGGFASQARAGADSWMVAGGPSDLQAGHGSTCVSGAKGRSQVDDLGVAVTGPGGTASAGQGGVSVTWAGGHAIAGEGGVAVADAPSSLEVGPMGVAVGTRHCRFRGGPGARFIARHADSAARAVAIATACVGIAGIKAGVWYAFNGDAFIPTDSGPPTA